MEKEQTNQSCVGWNQNDDIIAACVTTRNDYNSKTAMKLVTGADVMNVWVVFLKSTSRNSNSQMNIFLLLT